MKSRHPNSALEGLQGFQGIRSSPSMSWETSKLRPAFFGNRPMSRSRGPPQWKSLLIFQWIWLEGGWIPSTLVDLTWIHTEISHFYVSTVVFLEVGGWNPTVYHGHRIEIASELWILCLTRQDHRIGFSFFVLTSCPYWCWERPGSSAAQTVDGVFMPLWSLLWSNLWNAFLAVSGQSSVWTSCEMRFLWWKKGPIGHEFFRWTSSKTSCWFLLAYVFWSLKPFFCALKYIWPRQWRIRQEHRGLGLQNSTKVIDSASILQMLRGMKFSAWWDGESIPIWEFLPIMLQNIDILIYYHFSMKALEKYPQKLLLRAGMLLLALCIATVPVNSERCGGNVLKISILVSTPCAVIR